MNDPLPFSKEPKILAWEKTVADAGCRIETARPITVLRKRNGDLLFALLDTIVRAPDGSLLPNIAFIRGDACVVVTLIRNRDTGEERFLMVRQRRIGNGGLCLEFPAGMLDADVDDPAGVAVRELAEETGITVASCDLFPLNDKKLYSSAGACDEAIHYFGCVKILDHETCGSLAGRAGGNPEENERILLALVTREEAEQETTSLQVRLGFFLFEEYRKKAAAPPFRPGASATSSNA